MKRIMMAGVLVVFGLLVAGSAQAAYYGGDLCAYDEFNCVQVKRSDTWVKLFPDERERELVKRLNRMNVRVTNRSWIVVPADFDDLNYLDLSPFPRQLPDPKGEAELVVDLSDQAFGAYNAKGELIYWGPISGGKHYCADTESYCGTAKGSFRVTRKQGPECASSKFPLETNGGAPMPYCMHFFRGYAMHGAKLPGKHASHGCVRLFQSDASWLSKSFVRIGTPVTVRE